MIARMTLTRMAALVYAEGDLSPITGETGIIDLQPIEMPDVPFIAGEDRPAWQSSYGPPGNKRKLRQ